MTGRPSNRSINPKKSENPQKKNENRKKNENDLQQEASASNSFLPLDSTKLNACEDFYAFWLRTVWMIKKKKTELEYALELSKFNIYHLREIQVRSRISLRVKKGKSISCVKTVKVKTN